MPSSSASLARMLLRNTQWNAPHARSRHLISNFFRGYILSRGNAFIQEARFCRQMSGSLPTPAMSGEHHRVHFVLSGETLLAVADSIPAFVRTLVSVRSECSVSLAADN